MKRISKIAEIEINEDDIAAVIMECGVIVSVHIDDLENEIGDEVEIIYNRGIPWSLKEVT